MKSHRKVLTLNVPGRIGFVKIISEVTSSASSWAARRERIFYGKWDGRRAKRVLIKIIGK